MIDKWLALLNTMVVEGGRESHCTAADIQLFETHAGVKLPLGFGEYCQIFGSGEFNHCNRIWSPMSVSGKFDLRVRWPDDLSNLRQTAQHNAEMMARGEEGIDGSKLNRVQGLLTTALPFGDTCDTDIFAFDLDTFRDDDQSYDIYGIFEGFDVSPYCCLVGRDFFRFVNDFALGDELAKSACLAPHFVELWKQGASRGRSFYRLV